MKAFRHQEHGRTAEGVAATLAAPVPAAGARRARWPSAPPARRRSSSATASLTTITDAARAVVSRDLMPGWLPNMPAAAKATLPPTPARGRGRRLLRRLRQPHLRPHAGTRARVVARRGAGGRLRARRAAAVDSRRRRRPLLRDHLALEGLRGRQRADGQPDRWRACGAGATAARCRSSATRVRARSASPARSSPTSPPENRDASRAARHPRLDRLGARPAAAQAHRRGASSARAVRASELLDAASGRREEAARPRRGHGRRRR